MNMKRAVIAAVVAAAALAAAALVTGVPTGAQEEELLPISVMPTSGPAGTLVTISGAGCVTEAGPGDVEVYLFNLGEEEPAEVIGGIVPDDEGNWQTQGPVLPTDPVGVHPITATCFESPESDVVVADYDFAEFEVTTSKTPTTPTTPTTTPTTAPPPTTPPPKVTPTTTPPTTAPPSEPTVEEPAAPATPISARPTFTG